MNFDHAFDLLIDREGGYVNDPRDPGGETKFGISKRAFPDVDIKSLTRDGARGIYFTYYWKRARCDEMHPEVAFQVFDGAVNSGIENSIRWFQRAVGVADDGDVGPRTMEAMSNIDPARLVGLFNGERLLFMTKLQKFDVYGRGWSHRIAENLLQLKAP